MFDTFQTMNEGKRDYIYEYPIQDTTLMIKSWIDYIYTDQKMTSYNLSGATIKDTRELLGTDHKITYALLNVTEWMEHKTLNQWKSDNDKKLNRWDFKRARSEDWTKFGEAFKSNFPPQLTRRTNF